MRFTFVSSMAARPKPLHYRAHLRRLVGSNGERLNEILFDIARGNPWTPVTEDGLKMEPLAPTGDVRLRAAIFLHESLLGKAVSQREQLEAEAEAQEVASVSALDDVTLRREVEKLLNSGEIEEAVVVPALPEKTIYEWGLAIHAAQEVEEDDDSE